jgi:AhpD family alkylhydroperoxidase
MAAAPALYEAYLGTSRLFEGATTLSPLEQQVVLMTASYVNDCGYCVPGHTHLMKATGMPDEVVEALREGTPIGDSRLEALRTFARRLVEARGHLGPEEVRAFLAAGYSHRQALEVLVGLAAKMFSNYTHALAGVEVDPGTRGFAWTHPARRRPSEQERPGDVPAA